MLQKFYGMAPMKLEWVPKRKVWLGYNLECKQPVCTKFHLCQAKIFYLLGPSARQSEHWWKWHRCWKIGTAQIEQVVKTLWQAKREPLKLFINTKRFSCKYFKMTARSPLWKLSWLCKASHWYREMSKLFIPLGTWKFPFYLPFSKADESYRQIVANFGVDS